MKAPALAGNSGENNGGEHPDWHSFRIPPIAKLPRFSSAVLVNQERSNKRQETDTRQRKHVPNHMPYMVRMKKPATRAADEYGVDGDDW